ncbi:MAG: hypothetical protein AAGM22_32620, partial [Acidobacteriota bacterium]
RPDAAPAAGLFPVTGLGGSTAQAFSQDTSSVENSTENNDRFGFSLAAGDFDGDGKDDLVVSAPYEDDDKGSVHLHRRRRRRGADL